VGWKLKYRVPIGYSHTFRWHIDSLAFFVKATDEKESEWKEAVVEKELITSWGGYGRECGGARYRILIKPPRDSKKLAPYLPVAVGEYQYQACTPAASTIQTYAVTEIRFVSVCDVKIVYSDVEFTFLVRDTSEFIVEDIVEENQ
jgi:hypothetical protein